MGLSFSGSEVTVAFHGPYSEMTAQGLRRVDAEGVSTLAGGERSWRRRWLRMLSVETVYTTRWLVGILGR